MKVLLLLALVAVVAVQAQFPYCYLTPETQIVNPQQPTWIAGWNSMGNSINVTCLQVTTTGPHRVDLAIGCSDQWWNSTAQFMMLGTVSSSFVSVPTMFQCPMAGYFYVLATLEGQSAHTLSLRGMGTINGQQVHATPQHKH